MPPPVVFGRIANATDQLQNDLAHLQCAREVLKKHILLNHRVEWKKCILIQNKSFITQSMAYKKSIFLFSLLNGYILLFNITL